MHSIEFALVKKNDNDPNEVSELKTDNLHVTIHWSDNSAKDPEDPYVTVEKKLQKVTWENVLAKKVYSGATINL
ncbi:uncharacterized protein UTRI_01059 [Ustilago trichophora]|uniref:Uncharacterized protein n=1 Tax=Ustilago trichophora TaxID=86804 RepID=A0A5C3DYP1_9BASI|nr:uncharacterized protein UTRI_01059 [Ustilago trichophora]